MHKTTKQLHICKVRKQSVLGIISVIRRTLSQPAGLTTRGAVSCISEKGKVAQFNTTHSSKTDRTDGVESERV